MRIKGIMHGTFGGQNSVGNFFVSVAYSLNLFCHGLWGVGVELQETREIDRVGDVDGVRLCMVEGRCGIFACFKILRQVEVYISGSYNSLDGKPHAFGKDSSSESSHVATRNGEYDLIGIGALSYGTGIPIEEMYYLREEGTNVLCGYGCEVLM